MCRTGLGSVVGGSSTVGLAALRVAEFAIPGASANLEALSLFAPARGTSVKLSGRGCLTTFRTSRWVSRPIEPNVA